MPRRKLTGTVVSDRMERTVVVEVERKRRHPRYLKLIKSHKKFAAHDELGARVGDKVVIEESPPISKRKRWVVREILSSRL